MQICGFDYVATDTNGDGTIDYQELMQHLFGIDKTGLQEAVDWNVRNAKARANTLHAQPVCCLFCWVICAPSKLSCAMLPFGMCADKGKGNRSVCESSRDHVKPGDPVQSATGSNQP